MTGHTIRRILALGALATMTGVVGHIVAPAVADAGGNHTTTTTSSTVPETTTTTVAPTATSTAPPITIPDTTPTTEEPKEPECPPGNFRTGPDEPCTPYECDGTGDGISEHGYEDPTDGVCEWDLPDEQAPVPSQPPTCPTADDPACDIDLTPHARPAPVAVGSPAAETLPNTGSSSGVLAAAAVLLIAVGGGLVATTRRAAA